MFHAFGRVGCFFAGCCYGIPFSHGFVMHDSLNPVGDGVARFPVQLLEALLLLILFLVLNGIRKKRLSLLKEEGAATEQKRKPNRREGSLLPLYLLSYAVIRFGDEFLRGDTYRGIWLFFSTSQWISVFILAGIAIYYTAAGRRRTDTAA